jgi:hypothetical protein
MARQMEAEILFFDPDDLDHGVAALTELGFEVEVLDLEGPDHQRARLGIARRRPPSR